MRRGIARMLTRTVEESRRPVSDSPKYPRKMKLGSEREMAVEQEHLDALLGHGTLARLRGRRSFSEFVFSQLRSARPFFGGGSRIHELIHWSMHPPMGSMLSGVFPTFLGAFFTPSKFQSMMICMAKCSSDTVRRRPELILGQNAKEDREPHSCQLGTNEIV